MTKADFLTGSSSQSGVISGRVTKSVPQTPGKPKASQSSSTGNSLTGRSGKTPKYKYGFCPGCRFGHLVRNQINPEHPNKDIAGKYRLSCSHRESKGCTYYKILKTDPKLTVPPTHSKKPICPQCTMGQLLKVIQNPFNFKEQWMECDRKNALERPCDYRQGLNGKQLENTGAMPGTQPRGLFSDHRPDGNKLDKGKGKATEQPGPANTADPATRGPELDAGPSRAPGGAADLTEDGQFTPETTPERSPSPTPAAHNVGAATAPNLNGPAPGTWKGKSKLVETAADILSSQTVIDLVSDISSQASDTAGPGEGSSKQAETLTEPRKQPACSKEDAYLDEFDSSDDEELAHMTDYIYHSARKPMPQRRVKKEPPLSPIYIQD
ncbi:hypothetical protein SMACR_01300 [Sordaria macrospora]|uniref:Uncharacterized protein n=1 Tax=Sordaria macrospora TaxID=5147 RepID=A0A8S8ZSM5_SORMA|nr:hypothetical protein SMACR_01300 [Sordaria macrospora]WPJ58819.1 hypothetical protein SMAC4_01300 [Sordaria macrospora]